MIDLSHVVTTCLSCYGVHQNNMVCPHCNCGTLRQYRTALSLTQAELGQKIGRSERTIQRYESGATPIPKLVYNAVKKLFEDEVIK